MLDTMQVRDFRYFIAATSIPNTTTTTAISIRARNPTVKRATGKEPFVKAFCTLKYRRTPRGGFSGDTGEM